jgi:hypothetical protein
MYKKINFLLQYQLKIVIFLKKTFKKKIVKIVFLKNK